MKTAHFLVIVGAAVGTLGPPPYRPIPFPLVDQAAKVPELQRFRSHLLDIVRRRALDELMTNVEMDTPDAFARARSIEIELKDGGDDSWRNLERALSLGGAFTTKRGAVPNRREFCAPYTYAAFPEKLPEWIGAEQPPVVVVGTKVPVYKEPNTTSRVIARLSYVIVDWVDTVAGPLGSNPEIPGLVQIEIAPERRGWVEGRNVRFLDDWHVCIAQTGQEWKISEFGQREFY